MSERNSLPTRVVLIVDDAAESTEVLKDFEKAKVLPWIRRRRASYFKLVRLPALYFTVHGKPHFVEGLDEIRQQFLSKYSRA